MAEKSDVIAKLAEVAVKELAKPVFDTIKDIVSYLADKTVQAVRATPEKLEIFLNWWNGKTIAIIGATASGKNSFYARLLGKDPPKEHISSKGVEKVESFTVKRNIQNAGPIEFRCKRSVNVGGETDERIRFWAQACSDADFIFYLVDMQRLNDDETHEETQKRIGDDIQWIASHLSQFKKGCKIQVFLNKIDKVLEIPPTVDNRREYIESELNKHIVEMEKRVKAILDRNASALCGVSPISMMHEDWFNPLFDGALMSIYRQEHPA